MKRIKSFQYDDEKSPEVHARIVAWEREGKVFSDMIRRLIEGSEDDSLRREIEDIKRQLDDLRRQGVRVEVREEPRAEPAAVEESREVAETVTNEPVIIVNKNFVKNRYFKD